MLYFSLNLIEKEFQHAFFGLNPLESVHLKEWMSGLSCIRKTSNTYSTSFFIGFTSFYLILPHAPHAPRFISFTRFLFWAFYKDPFYTTWIFRYNFWVAAGNVWRWLCRHLRGASRSWTELNLVTLQKFKWGGGLGWVEFSWFLSVWSWDWAWQYLTIQLYNI